MPADTKIVWVTGMPRAGSMWCMNIARELLAAAGRTVLPEAIPQGAEKIMRLADEAVADRDPRRVWVLKTHQPIRPDAPRSVFVTPERDLRDALMSFMRFMRCDFETALASAQKWRAVCEHYAGFAPEVRLRLDYVEIADSPASAARQIAAFLGLELPPEAIEAAVAAFAKDKVAARISETEQSIRRRSAARQPVAPGELVRLPGGATRAFDLKTGFQTGHVSGYREGDWRTLLTPEQQRRLQEALPS